ncbi:MAG: VirD4-like conjugal transfer protein, CD1115 family [Ruminiclostridium sp.]
MTESRNFRSNIRTANRQECFVLPNGELFSLNGLETKLNNNVIVMGASGSGKTRSVVIPNLLAATGSYIVTDPKGRLYSCYADYMRGQGYNVIHLDFIHPEKSDGFNPFSYAKKPDEIMKLANYITYSGKSANSNSDPFWDNCANLLLSGVIGYMEDDHYPAHKRNISEITKLVSLIDPQAIENGEACGYDDRLNMLRKRYIAMGRQDPWSYTQYRKLRQTPVKTLNCILTTLHGNLGALDTPEICSMMSKPTVDFSKIGTEKTAVFVEVSDTDRSKDLLINTFFTQAMNSLCSFADEKCKEGRLPVPVRFILDDFGTNCRIEGFENMISNIRSRRVSATIILQSESQLRMGYSESAHTIMDNCDTFIYMGGNDVDTARTISRRANTPLSRILDMPVGTNWVFRRGQKPRFSETIDVEGYEVVACVDDRDKEEK